MIEVRGDFGEGGGQIVRSCLALSTLTGREFQITKIRQGRKQPGLKAQHLTAIDALKEICSAQTSEYHLGSTELWFKPGKIKKGSFNLDIGTAGSISLLLQALLLPCLFAPGKITLKIKGGTSGKWQASVDYLQNVLLPHLQKFGEKIEFKILKRGYYPKGGGEISISISPTYLNEFHSKLNLIPRINLTEQGKLEQIKGVVNCSNLLAEGEVAERIKESATRELKILDCPIDIRIEYAQTFSPGGELILWGKFSKEGKMDLTNPTLLSSSALAEKGKKAEIVGSEAARSLIEEIKSGACVDKYLADQLLIFMALLPDSKIEVSEITTHCTTNMKIIELFLPIEFKVRENEIQVLER